jgi:hypothetical protein
MKRICCYCKLDMGEKPPLDNPEVSHGICPDCVRKISNELIWDSLKTNDFKTLVKLMQVR